LDDSLCPNSADVSGRLLTKPTTTIGGFMETELEARLNAAECVLRSLLAVHPKLDVLKTLLEGIAQGITEIPAGEPDRAAVVQRAREEVGAWVSWIDGMQQTRQSAG